MERPKIETHLKRVGNRYFIKHKNKYSPVSYSDMRELEKLEFRFVSK